jgi:hypothetical protein
MRHNSFGTLQCPPVSMLDAISFNDIYSTPRFVLQVFPDALLPYLGFCSMLPNKLQNVAASGTIHTEILAHELLLE